MKHKKILILLFSLIAVSCGKKSTLNPPVFSDTNRASTKTDINVNLEVAPEVNERNCIDDKLNKDLDAGESVFKIFINTDFTFCSGVRLRLKSYLFSSRKYKAYGFVRSNSGKETCLTESESFDHKFLLGDQGVLDGNEIKILLGGHSFDENNKLKLSDHLLARTVKFDWGSYRGELAIFEKGKVKCWGIQ